MKLSVVIPAYNRATLLPLTLRSLLAQERVADEILVVDDGSSDGTAEIAEAFGDPVRVIRQSNQGPGAARNRGLTEAQGEFIHFFDSDDLALPNLHRDQLHTLQQTNADVAYSPWVKASLNPQQGVIPTNHVFQARGLPRGSLVHALLTNWSTVPMAWLVRRTCAEAVGGFPADLRCGEDQLFFLSMLLAGAHVVHSPFTLVLYRDEDRDKLSNPKNTGAHQRQSLDWTQTLVRARNLGLSHGHDPAAWFGFRRRAYLALTELQNWSDPPQSLMNSLHDIAKVPMSYGVSYRLSRALQQKGEGLTARLIGRRAHRSFRSSPLPAKVQSLCSEHLSSLLVHQPIRH